MSEAHDQINGLMRELRPMWDERNHAAFMALVEAFGRASTSLLRPSAEHLGEPNLPQPCVVSWGRYGIQSERIDVGSLIARLALDR